MHPNKEVINVIIRILRRFNWRWVTFLNSDNDFGIDGRNLFIQGIKGTDICLAHTENLNMLTDFTQTFQQIKVQKIHVIIVFAPKMIVEALIDSAIKLNITNKVWIADDGWSLNKNLPKKKGIRSIGTVIGVSQPVVTIPGFDNFIFSAKSQKQCKEREQQMFCNQVCKCGHLGAEEIISADPTFSFAVYSAVYAIAHALHQVLQCGAGSCNRRITVHPHMVSPNAAICFGDIGTQSSIARVQLTFLTYQVSKSFMWVSACFRECCFQPGRTENPAGLRPWRIGS